MAGGLRTFQVGSAARRGEGLRIAVTRHPPRGVAKKDWPRLFDVWFPAIAPSAGLIHEYLPRLDDPAARRRFFAAYERELDRSAEARQAVALLAAMALRTRVSIGCYCEDESRCHRSRLFEVVSREMERRRPR